MIVDFKLLGWDSWVVVPKEYNAYKCVGHCTFPLSSTDDPTNHANVQVR